MRCLILVLLEISLLFANGVGNAIIQESDGFVFELGKDPAQPMARERTIFSLSIHSAIPNEPIEAEGVWIKISKGDQIFFSSSDFRLQRDGPIFFVLSFPDEGDYSVQVSLDYENKKIESKFPVKVEGASAVNPHLPFLALLAALGFVVYWLLAKK